MSAHTLFSKMTLGCISGPYCYDKSAIRWRTALLALVSTMRLNILAAVAREKPKELHAG